MQGHARRVLIGPTGHLRSQTQRENSVRSGAQKFCPMDSISPPSPGQYGRRAEGQAMKLKLIPSCHSLFTLLPSLDAPLAFVSLLKVVVVV